MTSKAIDLKEWNYVGDVNLEYGGRYFRFDNDYCEVCEVTDLGGACGADGLSLSERKVTSGFDDKKRVQQALDCIGVPISWLRGKGKPAILLAIADGLFSYGYYDPLDSWCNYRMPAHWVIVNSDYGPLSDKRNWEAWKPDREQTVILHHKYDGDLEAYLEGEVLCY